MNQVDSTPNAINVTFLDSSCGKKEFYLLLRTRFDVHVKKEFVEFV